jgi:betaine-aldehyde dehydrogenase
MSPLVRDRLFIGGEWVAPAGTEVFETISPLTEEPIGVSPHAGRADVDRAVAAARAAFDHGPWPRMAPAERAAVMARIAALLAERSESLAALITDEMGSTISFSRAVQAGFAVRTLDYYGELAARAELEEVRSEGGALVVQEPVGVVAAIVPWNFPQMITMMKLGPALAAGCAVVLKPAPQTALDSYILAEVCAEAGLPPGVLSIVPAGPEAGEHLVTHAGVDKVSFTGSTAAGRRIAALCGKDIRRVTLELGGKSAAIVLEDADVAAAVAAARMSAFANAGQACVAQTRFVVHHARYAEVVEGLAELAASLAVGDPRDPATDVGPLATDQQRARVESYISSAREEGARVVTGGGRPAGAPRGWFVEPTVLADARNDMRAAREEIFGPVVCVIPAASDEEAIAIADDSDYGLGGSVWTADVARGLAAARSVRTGRCSINGAPLGVDVPFGGFKRSGIGREWGPEALRSYLETKAIGVPAGYLDDAQISPEFSLTWAD